MSSRKFLKSCAVVVLTCLLSANVFAGGTNPRKEKEREKEKDLYVLKTDRSFVGAQVSIYSSKGSVMTSQLLKKKKVVIDFSDVKEGFYLIRVSKGKKVKEFQFVKLMKDSKA